MTKLSEILSRAEKLLYVGNLKKSYDVALQGVKECSVVHRELINETKGWDVKKAFDYKGKFKFQGKKLDLWMEKFWNIIEETGVEPIFDDYETDMIEYDVYGNIIPIHLKDEFKERNS